MAAVRERSLRGIMSTPTSLAARLGLRPYVYVVANVLLFGVQAPFNRAWLKRFRFGPLEWLWRTLTCARLQPLRRAT